MTTQITLSTHPHTDQDDNPSKRIEIRVGAHETIHIRLGSVEARRLANALKPNGTDITLIQTSATK
jgi:hypothetical protein